MLLDQLQQLLSVTWDGNLICKADRDELVKKRLADKYDGFNYITKKGLRYLIDLKLIKRG